MNSDNIVARIDATFENTLQLNAELGEVTQIGKCKVLCGTTEEWNNQPELVAKEGYIYIYSDHKQNEDEQNIASFKVGDGSSLLIELPFTDDIIYEDIAALQTVVADIPTTASELPYDNSISGLESTNVNDAIDEVEDRVDEAEEDIVTLGTNKVDKVDPTTSGALSHTGNATVSGTVTAQNGFVGNLTGTASNATHAVSADSATNASSADEATHATSADSATNATNAGNADTVNNLTVLTAVPANAVFTDTTYTLGTDGNSIKLTPSSGSAQSITAPYASNAGTVNSHSVNADVPSGAKFTDTDNLVDLKDVDFTNLTDGQVIVWDAISEKFKNITLPDAMVFRGSLGTGGTISVLPVDGSASVGDTYKVITDGTYAGQVAKVGDTFICLTKTLNANTWVHIPSGDEPSGTVTSVKIEGSGAIVVDDESAITTSGVRTISHANSGATAGSYGDSGAQTPAYGATFKVPYITVDAKGHITGISEHTVKIPESDNTDELSELTDVSLTNPTQGQILKFTGNVWENADEVEPINVVANPSGTATTDLTKIQVGNDIYAIPEGGTDVEVTQIQSTGTKIATITVDNVPTDLYAPEGGSGGGTAAETTFDDSDVEFTADDVQEAFEAITKTVTQAQFDSLTQAEKDNGTIYLIDDANGDTQRFQPVIYSEEEREIGIWKDGKPLYEKMIVANVTANQFSIDVSDLNIDNVIVNDGFIVQTNGNIVCEPYGSSNYDYAISYYNNNNIKCSYAGAYNTTTWNIRIRYTKTTDAPGSGSWTNQGVPAVHFSTDEKIIGTWVDGSTLYERTILVSSGTINGNGGTKVIFTDTNIKRMVTSFGYLRENNVDFAIPDPSLRIKLNNSKQVVLESRGAAWHVAEGYVTIRYTKAS